MATNRYNVLEALEFLLDGNQSKIDWVSDVDVEKEDVMEENIKCVSKSVVEVDAEYRWRKMDILSHKMCQRANRARS